MNLPNSLTALPDQFEARSAHPCIVDLDGRAHSYGSLWANARALAQQWAEAGVQPGDVVAFSLPNGVAMPCCYVACLIGAFIACPIVPTSHPSFVRDVVELVSPTLILEEPPVVDPSRAPAKEFSLTRAPESPFLITFTSGLTGTPKAMLHAASGVLGSAHAFANLTQMRTGSRLYHVLPMAYMAGILNAFLAPAMAGATIVEGPLFSPETAVDFWTRPLANRVDTLSITPTIAAALARLTRDPSTIASIRDQLRQVQCTSALIPTAVRERFFERFGHPLQDCYGITELGGPISIQARADAESGVPFTTPLSEIDIELRGDGDELWIRSPYSMLGYLETDALARPFDDRGFLNTGDLAVLDRGRIGITGRRKDIIIRGGINVSPAHVESVLGVVPGVEEVVVIGLDHEFWGEIIVACVVLSESSDSDSVRRIRSHAVAELAVHERPDRVVVVDSIPRSFVGKIQKDVLRQRLASGG